MTIDAIGEARKKKILVLVSRGGGGHKTAAMAIQEILGDTYDIEINYVLQDILQRADILNIITRGRFTGEDLYNFFLKRHQKKCLTWMIKQREKRMTSRTIERLFDNYLFHLSHKPDLIISPTPFINYGIACATSRYKIPFLIMPTDLDGSTFLDGFPQETTGLNFMLSLPYDDQQVLETTLQKRVVAAHQIQIGGFPVRPASCHTYTLQQQKQLRANFHLLDGHKTVTLIMGALGGNLIVDHVRALLRMNPALHGLAVEINICTGDNQKVGKKVEKLLHKQGAKEAREGSFVLPSGLVLHLRGYLPNLIELMAVSDLLITKPGSCTVNEAIYLGKKVIVDNTKHSTARCLPWEAFNISFVEKNGLGSSFTDCRQLPMLVLSLLKFTPTATDAPIRPCLGSALPQIVRSIIKN